MERGAIAAARLKARKALSLLEDDTCVIFALAPVLDDATGVTRYQERVLASNVPCRVSFSGSGSPTADSDAPQTEREPTLFLPPGTEVPAGCKIRVIHQGQATDYSRSGVPAVYAAHLEIKLALFERYA